jgi:CheY-like chemotaxis protein
MLDDEEMDAPAASSAPLVLIADDDPATRSAVCRMVRGLGYRARSADGGRQALRYLETHSGEVRLLLADVGMPGMDGAELAERARDLDPRLHVVLLAGTDPEVGELLAGYRDVPTLAKPVGFGDLYGLLRELLGAATPTATRPAPPGAGRPRSSRRPSGRHEV